METRYKTWKKLGCCCVTEPCRSYSEKQLRKKASSHNYCGCKESKKLRGRQGKMKSCDVDRRALVDNEDVFEAIDYDFINNEEVQEDCFVENPETPLSYNFTSVLHPQSNITIQGRLNKNAIRFAINLTIGRNENPDLAFHFNPRLDQLYSARNSRFDDCWGHEEGNSQHKFPFKRGQGFHIQLFLTHSEFLVAVNGLHYCSYTYRTSLLNITTLQIEGNVNLAKVHINSTSVYPAETSTAETSSPYRFSLIYNTTINNVSQMTPVYASLEENLKLNSTILIVGVVKKLPFSFYINLQESSRVWPHPEIPLHMSIRFNQGGEHVVLANTWLQNGWGREQLADSKYFFTPGHKFVLEITNLEDGFSARVDDQPLIKFKHRVPSFNINTLHIQGDVFIHNITLNS